MLQFVTVMLEGVTNCNNQLSLASKESSPCNDVAVLTGETILFDVLVDVVCEFPVLRYALACDAAAVISDLPDGRPFHPGEFADACVPEVEILFDDALLCVGEWVCSCHSEMSFCGRISTCDSSTFAPFRFTR